MIGQPLLWLPVSTTPAGISPVCFRKPGRFLTRVLLQRCWRRPWASPPWPYWASWSKVNGMLGEKAKLGLTWATPAPLIFIDNQLYAKGNFSLAVRFTEHLKAAKTRVTGHWIESSKMLAGRSNWDCVRACARSLFLSAGDLRSEDVPSASTLHFWTSRVWEGLQSSVSHFFFRLFTRVCVYWTTFFFFNSLRCLYLNAAAPVSSVQSQLFRILPHLHRRLVAVWSLLQSRWSDTRMTDVWEVKVSDLWPLLVL